ncbi:hypothetical protein T484DRAFT_1809048 [Baffinella frigidus]|nr:hypothetical protein T484DRAFT_1809048 [Cryptophyta sp. CCMP2293]
MVAKDQFASISEEVSTTHARMERTIATMARNAAMNIAAGKGRRWWVTGPLRMRWVEGFTGGEKNQESFTMPGVAVCGGRSLEAAADLPKIFDSAIFNFQSLLIVILLTICTCAYIRANLPSILDRNKTGCAP